MPGSFTGAMRSQVHGNISPSQKNIHNYITMYISNTTHKCERA